MALPFKRTIKKDKELFTIWKRDRRSPNDLVPARISLWNAPAGLMNFIKSAARSARGVFDEGAVTKQIGEFH